MATKTQPYRLNWSNSKDLRDVDRKLSQQMIRIDEMFQGLYDRQKNIVETQEGFWTPQLGGESVTSDQVYTLQAGRYIKVGKLVFAWGGVTLANKGTITGAVRIRNLPFVCESVPQSNDLTSVSHYPGFAAITYWFNLNTNWIALNGLVSANTTNIFLSGRQSAGATVQTLATADITDTTGMYFGAVYSTAD